MILDLDDITLSYYIMTAFNIEKTDYVAAVQDFFFCTYF